MITYVYVVHHGASGDRPQMVGVFSDRLTAQKMAALDDEAAGSVTAVELDEMRDFAEAGIVPWQVREGKDVATQQPVSYRESGPYGGKSGLVVIVKAKNAKEAIEVAKAKFAKAKFLAVAEEAKKANEVTR